MLKHRFLNLVTGELFVVHDSVLELNEKILYLSDVLLDDQSRSIDVFEKSVPGLSELVVGDFNAVQDFGILVLYISLNRLTESAPLVISSMGSVGRKDDTIVFLLKNIRVLIDETNLTVQITSL